MKASSGGPRLAVAGAVTGIAGLAVSYAATSVLSVRATPAQAVGEAVIALTPGPVAEALIGLVGRYDKPLLITGVTLAVLAISAAAGILAGRRLLLGDLVFVLLGGAGLAAMLTRPGSAPYDVLPVAAGTVTCLLVLGSLVDASRRPQAVDLDRRAFLRRSLLVAGGAAGVALVGGLLGRGRRGVEASRRLLRLPVTGGRVPAQADLGVAGVAVWRTANPGFYRIDTALVVPTVDPEQWRLRIFGRVDREISLSYRDLLRRQLTEAWVTICCVSNPVGGDLIGNAWWSGVRVADLLAEAGVQAGADAVLQTSKDGWTCGTPLPALTDDRNALLAVAMNGEPLPLEHGFPVRTIVPGLYGYVSATKWLVSLEVTRFDRFSAYWTRRGWSPRGPVKTQSRIDVPRNGADLPVGRRRVGGVAWAQHTGIERVEYRLDGAPWRVATLGRVPGVDTWVQWAGTVELGAGDHYLAVRATDRSGATQTSVRRDVVPDGATGWHTVRFTAS